MQPTLMFDFKEGGLVLFLHSEYIAALSTKIRLFPWGWKVLVVIFGKTELVYINTSKADSVFSECFQNIAQSPNSTYSKTIEELSIILDFWIINENSKYGID